MDAFDQLMVVFALAAFGPAAFAFCRPRGVVRVAAWTLGLGLVASLALALLVSLFADPAAGLGLAMMTLAASALVCIAALSAALGAGARYGWNALLTRPQERSFRD